MGESPGKMYALATVLSLLAIVAVILRLCARRAKRQLLAWDDYLIISALASESCLRFKATLAKYAQVFTIGTGICMFVGTAAGDLGRHTRIGPDGMPILTRRVQVFQQINYASLLTATLTLGVTKLSVLLFYRRIFSHSSRVFGIAVWTMFAIVIAWTIAFFFSNLLQCLPISANWTGLGGSYSQCINENMMYLGQAYSDTFTDVIILSLPIPAVWALQMPVSRKLGVLGIFFMGALVVAASITKLVIFYYIISKTQTTSGDLDITYLLTPTVYWPMVESSLGIVGACLPSIHPLIHTFPQGNFFRSLKSVLSISSARSSRSRSYCKQPSSPPGAGKDGPNSRTTQDSDRSDVELTPAGKAEGGGFTFDDHFNPPNGKSARGSGCGRLKDVRTHRETIEMALAGDEYV